MRVICTGGPPNCCESVVLGFGVVKSSYPGGITHFN